MSECVIQIPSDSVLKRIVEMKEGNEFWEGV